MKNMLGNFTVTSKKKNGITLVAKNMNASHMFCVSPSLSVYKKQAEKSKEMRIHCVYNDDKWAQILIKYLHYVCGGINTNEGKLASKLLSSFYLTDIYLARVRSYFNCTFFYYTFIA